MAGRLTNLKIRIWRQPQGSAEGRLVDYTLDEVSTEMSFLEMIDVLNSTIIRAGGDPVAFEHDCREGICGSCSMVINGNAHGPQTGTTACQLHMRHFRSGDTLVVEPFRAKAFPVLKDLIVDRSAFDRIMRAGGYVSVNTGAAQDANCLPVPKAQADLAMDAAACIGCGACVAACANGSAMLFVSAKISHLSLLPQGEPERATRAKRMLRALDEEAFGSCTNMGSCAGACPKRISVSHIARANRELLRAAVQPPPPDVGGGD